MDIRYIKTMFFRVATIMVVLATTLSVSMAAYAAPTSPFVGHWQAIDVDGSDIRLSIAGPPNGPYQITWTESYISFCNREAGIVRGVGWLNEENANLLDADLHVECFTTGASLEFHLVWRYHPTTNTLSSIYENGFVTIWHRPGGGQVEEPPALGLRVNYGHDWVESFYEAGHTAWVTVTDGEENLKATAEVVTESKDYWGEETGFQTNDSVWFDEDGNQLEYPPDIQSYDWVYGWIDNGASAQVQIGEITGMIDFETDTINGTVYTPWFSGEVGVECFAWGSGDPSLDMWYGPVQPDENDPYSCSWYGLWEIDLGQDIGVGYFGPDGHWVANAFYSYAHVNASEEGDWLWTSQFTTGELLTVSIYASRDPELEPLWQDSMVAGNDGFIIVHSEDHELDLEPGNYIVVSDSSAKKGLVLEPISIDVFDTINDVMAGTAPKGREVLVGAGLEDYQESIWVFADGDTEDPETGAWYADFGEIEYDITEDMRPWSWAQIIDADSDANEGITPPPPPNPRFTVFPAGEWFDGYDWPDGAIVAISVEGKPECQTTGESWGGFFNGGFPEGCDLMVGDVVTFADGVTTRTHTVQNLAITAVDKEANTVTGTADVGALVFAWVHEYGYDMQLQTEDGTWFADFGSAGLDLVEKMGGRAEVRDEFGNGTAVDWWIPNPRFTVFPEWEWFDGYDWPDGVIVNITVQDKPECTTEGVSSGNFFNGGFPEGCDVVVDDVVTFTDGETIRTHTVQNLAITEVDKQANTVTGTADADRVFAWVHEYGYDMELQVEDTTWLADFGSAGLDLVENMSGRVEIRDEFGNGTAADWWIPNPSIVASITEDWFYVNEFTPNAELSFAVYASQGGTLVSQGTTPPTDGSGHMWVNADGLWDLEPGNYLVVSDGLSTKDLVIEGFTFDVFNATNGQLSGTAPVPYGRNVWVGIGWENDGWSMDVTTDESGAWFANFGQPVPTDYWWVAAQIFDDDGDASELRPASQITFLRPRCGDNYTVQAGSMLEIRYGSWLAKGEELAIQNAEHLTVNLVLDGVPVTGAQQPVVPGSEIPCGASAEAYGVFYVTQVEPLSPGTHIASVTWSFDEQVTDGGDVDADGVLDLYGPGVVVTHEFTLIVP